MSQETLAWLRHFDKFDLLPQERLALAYLRANEGFDMRLYNRDYVRLTGCTSVEATQALRRMVDKGLILMQNTRGAAYYTLSERIPEAEPNLLNTAITDEEKIVELAHREGRITAGMCISRLAIPRRRASALLRRLSGPDQPLEKHGKGRWRYYTLVPQISSAALATNIL